ncbi:bifunctional riboflavin kinase/FAD synthetase [Methylotenera versatilis]|uniref:bifunctional riboflavin kinase/FAD synthetase n=1 Tax=Methylotenera versatilis TaxID=1055487 RepID=UPI000645F9B6|nr:bifunctional riboflavin kinase/FAD synthetase [Methylotenera versatilis]
MQVFRHIPATLQSPIALAIGNFDGMHLGHQALLARLIEVAKAKNITPAVMTFEPHPREFFTPLNAPSRLCNLREKLEYFIAAGVEQAFVCAFNQHFSAISAQVFMDEILREKMHVSTILVGEDFRFGARRTGTIDDFKANQFDLIDFAPINFANERISSTRVRDALSYGNLQLASGLLGRHYSISGKVVHGAKRGRELGFPTANIHIKHERPALTGVYAVKLDGLNAVANLGVRPTIAGVPKLSLEVHILDFNENLYGRHVHVEFLHKIRDEMKFSGLDALKTQITKDVIDAREFFSTTTPARA